MTENDVGEVADEIIAKRMREVAAEIVGIIRSENDGVTGFAHNIDRKKRQVDRALSRLGPPLAGAERTLAARSLIDALSRFIDHQEGSYVRQGRAKIPGG